MSQDQVDLFSADNTPAEDEENKSFYETLVGEGKKFKDNEALARAKWHSDRTIQEREQELNEIRKELDKRLSLEELLAKIERTAAKKANNQIDEGDVTKQKEADPANLGDNGKSTPGFTQDDINKFVRDALSQESMKRTVAQNGEYVRNTLKQTWGNDFHNILAQRTEELGMTKEEATQLAGTKPDVLLAALGVQRKQKQVDGFAPIKNAFNSAPSNQTRLDKNFAFFEKLRKENIREWMQPSTQREMFELARKHGDAFYK
jgi:hypothetical protein